MMDLIDPRLIVNTAIGTTIGGLIVAFLFLPSVMAWLDKVKNWTGWKKTVWVIGPITLLFILFALLWSLSLWIDYSESKKPGFAFSCQGECTRYVRNDIYECSHVGNLYGNEDTRIDVYKDDILRSMLPDYPPEPIEIYPGRKKGRMTSFDAVTAKDLARRIFFGCMHKLGYSIGNCVSGAPCYQFRSITFYDPKKDKFSQTDKLMNGIRVILKEPLAENDQSE